MKLGGQAGQRWVDTVEKDQETHFPPVRKGLMVHNCPLTVSMGVGVCV